MRFKINIYIAFLILIFHVFNFSFSQSELPLSKAQKKEIQKNKKLEKKLRKLQNPKWLTIIDGYIGRFTDDKSTYRKNPSFEANFDSKIKSTQGQRADLLYGYKYGYDKLEKRIIQIVLFRPEITEIQVTIKANCNDHMKGDFSSEFGYQGIQMLYLYERDIEIIRKINKVEFFLADQKVTHPSIHQKMIYAINNLCRS